MGNWNTSNGVDYTVTRQDGSRWRVTAGGKDFVRSVQYRIKLKIGLAGAAWNGTVYPSDVQEDGNWGLQTMRGLYAAVRASGGPPVALQSIQRDAALPTGSPISAGTIRAAIMYVMSDHPERSVEFPAGTELTMYQFQQPQGNPLHYERLSAAVPGVAPTPPDAPPPPPPLVTKNPTAIVDESLASGADYDPTTVDPWSTWRTISYAPTFSSNQTPSLRPSSVVIPTFSSYVPAFMTPQGLPQWAKYAFIGVGVLGIIGLVAYSASED